jgi:intein/homing endonuclease
MSKSGKRYGGVRLRIEYTSSNYKKMKVIQEELKKLGIKGTKIQTEMRITYSIPIQRKSEIKTLGDFLEWKAPTHRCQNQLNAIKQYITSPLA